MNEEKINIITLVIQLLLITVQIFIVNLYCLNLDLRSYYIGLIMASITFFIWMTRSIIIKITKWLVDIKF